MTLHVKCRDGETPREARNRYMREWRAKNPEKVRAIKRRYYLKNREKILAARKVYREQHREGIRKQNREYGRRRRDREKKRLREKHHYKKNRNRILERDREYQRINRAKRTIQARARHNVDLAPSCSRCGSTKNLERHHPDYSKPLEVETLCRSCHQQEHSEYPSDNQAIRVAIRDLLNVEAWGRRRQPH